jgi:polysaccharide export outer membrane protein
MSTACRSLPPARLRAGLACSLALALLAGCQAVNVHSALLDQPVPPSMAIPSEKRKVSLPSYRIEPPDIVNIDMQRLVPLPPYRADVYDFLQIRVSNALSDQPIDGYFMVEAEGVVNLGPAYGSVRLVGMTLEEAKKAIEAKLGQVVREPEVSVQLARIYGAQPVSGQYLVGPDGTINLRQYGVVHVAGLTVTEARLAIQKHLSRYLDSPQLSVEVVAYNSKVYYVVTQGAGMGDSLRRFPITGNETVLDALSQVGGLSQLSSCEIWIARPAPGNFGCEQVMPVDWVAITQGGSTVTNYQVLPGDRVFIAQDQMTTLTTWVGKMVGPFERAMGFLGLTSSTVRGFQTLGRDYNHPQTNPTF